MTTDNSGAYTAEPYAEFWAQIAEKQRLRRVAWAVALPGIIFFFVSRLWGEAAVFIGELFGIRYEKTIEFFSDPAVSQLLQITLSMLLMTVPFILCAKIAGIKVSDSAGLYKPKKGTALPCILLGLGFCSFANIAVSAASEIFGSFGIDYSVPRQEYPEGFFGFMLVTISTAIVPALVEEFAFRGIVFGALRPFGEAFCIFASSAVFGILHGNFEQMPFAFLVGLALAFIRVKSGSITVCAAVHALNNFISVLAAYTTSKYTAAANLIYSVYIMLALLAAIFGLYLLRGENSFTLLPYRGELGAKRAYSAFFFSPAIIIFSLLFFYRALTYVF